MRMLPSLFLLAVAVDAPAQPAQDNAAKEIWETVFARDAQGRDQQIGYSKLTLKPEKRDDKKLLVCTRELKISFKRDGQTAQMRAESGTEEDEKGKVTGVFMKQWLGEQQALTMKGSVDESGKSITIKVDSTVKGNVFKNPWDPKVVGISGELTLYRDRKVKPGDRFSYRFFEPTVSSVVTIQVNVKELEAILLPRGGKKELLRVESKPEKIESIQLPTSVIWLDPKTLDPVLTQTDVPGIGLLTLERSTQGVATGILGEVPDLMKLQTIRLRNRIDGNAHALDGMVYRVTVTGKESDPAKLIKEDDRQSIKELKGNSFELHIDARRSPRRLDKEKPAAAEFLESNHFINSKDENVKKLAEKAVGNLTDPWDKAKAIERWVKANMKAVNYTEAMATSDHVAKTLSGDCSEYAMLMAAMCRAQGIPSRTALGLVYVDNGGRASLPFHMWTEVYVKGQWLGLDATMGLGSIGPGHIKITDHSWHDVLDFKPLLPVTGFLMAKPEIKIERGLRVGQ